MTATFTMTSYAADSFTIRVLDEEGNVQQRTNFTLEQMQKMATEQHYVKYMNSVVADYKVSGVTLNTLFAAADIEVGKGDVLKFLSNYTTDNSDENDVITENPRYNDSVTYEEYMAKRYTFTNLYDSEQLEKIANAGWDSEPIKEIFWNAEKQTVEPMISVQYGYQILRPGVTESNFDYDKITGKAYTFGLFMGTEIDESADASSIELKDNIYMYSYGIDIVKTSKPLLKDKQVKVTDGTISMTMENVDYTWMKAITGIYLDGSELSKQEYKIKRSYYYVWGESSYLYINCSAFDQQKERTKKYQVRIEADGYEEVTATLTVTKLAANDFTIRVIDENGSVQQTYTFSKEQMVSLCKEVEQNYILTNYYLAEYKIKGVTLSALLSEAGISFEEGDTLKLRTNNYAYSNDLSNDADAYEKSYTYEDLMKERYTFSGLHEKPLYPETWTSELQNYEKIKVEPIFALTYGCQSISPYWEPGEINYLSRYEAEAFTFFAGVEFEEGVDGSQIAIDNTSYETATVFGIDIITTLVPTIDSDAREFVLTEQESYSIRLQDYDIAWMAAVQEIQINDETVTSDLCKLTQGEHYDGVYGEIGFDASLFVGQTEREKTYKVRILADGYRDSVSTLTVTNYGARSFTIRTLNSVGEVVKTVTLDWDTLLELTDITDTQYVTSAWSSLKDYKATGISLSTLLEAADIEFTEGQVLKVRTNKNATTNDSATEWAYAGTYTYEDLMQTRYTFPEVYTNDSLKDVLYDTNTTWSNSQTRQEALAESNKEEVEPMFAYLYSSQMLGQNISSAADYRENVQYTSAFQFLYGMAMDEETGIISSTETEVQIGEQNTVYGIDIVDTKISLTVTPVVQDSYEYDGEAVEVSNQVEDSYGNVITNASDYMLVLKSYYREILTKDWVEGVPVNVGTYEVQYRPTSWDQSYNMEITSVPKIIQIQKKTAMVYPKAGLEKYVDDEDPSDYLDYVSGVLLGETITYELTRKEGESAGTYAYCLTADEAKNPNYNIVLGGKDRVFTIKKHETTIKLSEELFKPENCIKVYDGTDFAIDAGVYDNDGNKVAEVSFTYEESTTSPLASITDTDQTSSSKGTPSSAGTYVVSASYAGDYKYESAESQELSITIMPKPVTITMTTGQWKYLDQDDPSAFDVSIDGIVNKDKSDIVIKIMRSKGTVTDNYEEAGKYAYSYDVVADDAVKSNYTFTFNNDTYELKKYQTELEVETKDTVYDGTAKAVLPTVYVVDGTNKTKLENAAVSIVYTRKGTNTSSSDAPVHAGTYIATVTYAGDMLRNAVEKSVEFTITRKEVTITPTAAQSKVEDEKDPTFTFTTTGVVSGEEVVILLSRQAGEAAGKYAYVIEVDASSAVNSNYEFVLVSNASQFEITAKPVVDKPEVDQPEVDQPTEKDPVLDITNTTVSEGFTIAPVVAEVKNYAVIAVNELIANKMTTVLEMLAEKLTSTEQEEVHAQIEATLTDDTKEVTYEFHKIVDLTATDAEMDADGNYWVTLSDDKIRKDAIIVVLHYKEAEEEWETIVPEEVTDDQIIFKTGSFSPFAVIELAPTDVAGSENPAKNPSDSNGVPTGDNTSKVQITMWLMLVLSAGTAAVVARRKRRVE